MSSAAPHPRMHGITHVPGGPDPIPGLGGDSLVNLITAHIGDDLVSWWRMGEAQADGPNQEFDYAQNPAGDKPLGLSAGSGAAVSWDVTGGLDAPDDDGALQFNYNQPGNDGSPNGSAFAATDSTGNRWAFTGTAAFTVMCLFKPTASWSSNGNLHGLVSTHNVVGGTLAGWALTLFKAGSGVGISFVRAASPGSITTLTGPDVITSGAWHHLAATYDGTTMRVYVDGVLVNYVASSVSVASRQTIDVGKTTISQADQWQRYVYGIIDEVAVFNAALSGSEILEMARGVGSSITPPVSSGELLVYTNGA